MCGRYAFFTDKELDEIDKIIEEVNKNSKDRQMKTGEIFPTDAAPVLIPEKNKYSAHLLTWGFPAFKSKGVIINARAETVHEKKMFKSAIESRRCVIPSTGFYEWDTQKRKFLFNMPDSDLLYMCGIYNQFDGENRFVILTTDANDSVFQVHNRMPLIITKNKIEDWIFNARATDEIISGRHPALIKKSA